MYLVTFHQCSIKLPVLTVAGDDSQPVSPGHGNVGVPQNHDCIQTLRQGELHEHEEDSRCCLASATFKNYNLKAAHISKNNTRQ